MPDPTAPDPFDVLANQPIQMPNVQTPDAQPSLAPQPVRGQSRLPGVAGLISNLVHPPTQVKVNPQTKMAEARPTSRLDVFENFLGNFLYALGQGMANQGTGPGSFSRGFGAAVTAPMQRDMQMQQLAQQRALQQSQAEEAQSRGELFQKQAELAGTMVTLPNGMQVPASQIGQIMRGTNAAEITAKSRMSVEQMKAMLAMGQVSKVMPVMENGQMTMRAFNKYNQPIGDIDGAIPPASYLPKSSSTQEFKQLEDGTIVSIPKTTTSGPIIPRAVGQGGTPVRIGKGAPATSSGVRVSNGVVTDNQGNALNFKGGISTSTKTMMEAAPKVIDFVDRISKEVEDQKNRLGPVASRWNEFMAGKVGAPNPEFTALRTNIGLLSTLLMRMHVGARGGEQIMEHFQNMIDSGKQSPENLQSALQQIRLYANDVVSAKPVGPGISTGKKAPVAALPQGGSKVDSLLKRHGF